MHGKDILHKSVKKITIAFQSFNNIKKFFDTMPRLRHEIEVENPKTKVKSKVTLQGLQDFFE